MGTRTLHAKSNPADLDQRRDSNPRAPEPHQAPRCAGALFRSAEPNRFTQIGSARGRRVRRPWRDLSGSADGPGALEAALGLDEAAPDCVAGQLDSVSHAELLEDVGAMAIDGLLADEQHLADLVARVALGNQLDDLEFARTQWILGRLVAAASAIEVVANQGGDRRGIEEGLAAHRGATGLDQIPIGRALQHVPGGSRLESLEEVALVVVHRKHQDAHLRLAPAQLERR